MAFTVITYSEHAKERMQQRRIAENQVDTTLRNPDLVLIQDNGKLRADRKTSNGNLIRVIYIERLTTLGQEAHVVSVIRIAGRRAS